LRRGTGEACFGSANVGETMKLTGGAHVVVTAEEGVVVGLRKLEEDTAFGKYAKAAQARTCRAHARWLAVRSGPARARLGRVG
jgi:hypothetical protein